MSVEHISQGSGTHPLHQNYLDAKKKVESQNKGSGEARGTQSDKIHISDDAKMLVQRDAMVQQLQKTLETLPDVRPEKVQQGTERVASGFYDQKGVYEKVAGSLLSENSETELEDVESQSVDAEAMEIRLDKIREAQKRIEENYYERREII